MSRLDIHHHFDPEFERRFFETLSLVILKLENIMTAISDYAAAVQASYAQLNTALDDIKTEIASLNDKITQLQNNPGPISPEDQALLDAAQQQAGSLVAKAQALDTIATPPAPPPANPPA